MVKLHLRLLFLVGDEPDVFSCFLLPNSLPKKPIVTSSSKNHLDGFWLVEFFLFGQVLKEKEVETSGGGDWRKYNAIYRVKVPRA